MVDVDRRVFQTSLAAGAIAGLSPRPAQAQVQQRARPNIVVIIADDLRWDSLGIAGNRAAITPHIDRLAQDGIRFADCFVTTSICPTSRASIATGQYASRHAIWSFHQPLTPEQFDGTYHGLLRKAGYRTGFVGKWGLGGALPEAHFDVWRGFEGQGRYFNQVGGEHLGDVITRDAVRFIDDLSGEQPFCLTLSFKEVHEQDEDVHAPYQPRNSFKGSMKDVTIPVPSTATDRHFRALPPELRDSIGRQRWEPRFSNPELFQQRMRDYYELLMGLDASVGAVRAALQRKGLDDETIILFTSDNGNMLGDHGLAAKWWMYEESLRVPFIIKLPVALASHAGKVRSAMTLNIDVAPTLLELAGLPAHSAMQGASVIPLLNNRNAPWRNAFYYEHLLDIPKLPQSEGVRTQDLKYIRYVGSQGQSEQLFDIRNDPFEETNLINAPAYAARLSELKSLLTDLRQKAR